MHQEAPKRPQETPKRSPGGPQEASRRPPGGPQEAPKLLPIRPREASKMPPRGGAVRKGNALDHLRLQAWWDLASCEGAFEDCVWSRTNLFLSPMVPWTSDESMFVDLFV